MNGLTQPPSASLPFQLEFVDRRQFGVELVDYLFAKLVFSIQKEDDNVECLLSVLSAYRAIPGDFPDIIIHDVCDAHGALLNALLEIMKPDEWVFKKCVSFVREWIIEVTQKQKTHTVAELLHNVLPSVEVVRLIVAIGIDVNARDDFDATPLHTAARDGHAQVVPILVQAGASMWSRNWWGQNPLDVALLSGHLDVQDALFSCL